MAFDAFLKIDGLPGESTDEKHKEWLEVLSYSHGISQPKSGSTSSGGSMTSMRCDHQDFSFVKVLDKTSPKLALYCSNGTHIKEVTLELCRAGGDKQKYMQYKMNDVIVSGVRPGGTSQGGETLPLEEISLAYVKIEWVYIQLDPRTGQPKGEVKAYWDLEANKGG